MMSSGEVSSESAVEVVHQFWERMQSNDLRWTSRLLGDDFVLDWPQSREGIGGRTAFAAMNEAYLSHGRWDFTLLRVVRNDAEAVSDASVTDGVQQARAISFFSVQGGRITALIEFWPKICDPQENRSHLVETLAD